MNDSTNEGPPGFVPVYEERDGQAIQYDIDLWGIDFQSYGGYSVGRQAGVCYGVNSDAGVSTIAVGGK